MLDQATARATMKWQVAPGREPIRLDAFVRECLPQHSRLLGVGKNRWEPGLVHRLDTETSGLVLVAKTQTAFDRLREQFRRRQVAKIYWALVWGTTNSEGVIDLPLAHDPRDKRRM